MFQTCALNLTQIGRATYATCPGGDTAVEHISVAAQESRLVDRLSERPLRTERRLSDHTEGGAAATTTTDDDDDSDDLSSDSDGEYDFGAGGGMGSMVTSMFAPREGHGLPAKPLGEPDDEVAIPRHMVGDTSERLATRRDGGIGSRSKDGSKGTSIYFLGIIDILQQYNSTKRAEVFMASI